MYGLLEKHWCEKLREQQKLPAYSGREAGDELILNEQRDPKAKI